MLPHVARCHSWSTCGRADRAEPGGYRQIQVVWRSRLHERQQGLDVCVVRREATVATKGPGTAWTPMVCTGGRA